MEKNRLRAKPDFANINLFGKCNVSCFFCLGNDLKNEFSKFDHTGVHFEFWKNFDMFLAKCYDNDIKKIYVTGQNVDSLQYQYLEELVDFLVSLGFKVGIRTNGYLGMAFLDMFNNKCELSIGYSFHTQYSRKNYHIMKRHDLPHMAQLLEHTERPRVSVVINRWNWDEVDSLVEYFGRFKNVRYVQMRRVSTDTRQDFHKCDQDFYDIVHREVKRDYPLAREFYGAEIYRMYGKDVCFWPTIATKANSFNYFTDGTVSEEYFIIEGYLKNKES